MKKLNNTEGDLKKSVVYKKAFKIKLQEIYLFSTAFP